MEMRKFTDKGIEAVPAVTFVELVKVQLQSHHSTC